MADFRILKSEQYKVFQLLQDSGLEPTDFEWIDLSGQSGDLISIIRYRPDREYYFAFEHNQAGRASKFSPARAQRESAWHHPLPQQQQLELCKEWIGYLKREIEIPEWEAMFRVRASLVGVSDSDNTQFTESELRSIRERLSLIEADIISQRQLTEEQTAYVKSEFRQLAASASRLGRKDWKTFAMGTAVNIALYLAQPSVGTALLNTLTALWASLHGGPALPTLP